MVRIQFQPTASKPNRQFKLILQKMKRILIAAILLISAHKLVLAQASAPTGVNRVIEAEKNFNKLIERKGIKAGFLAVADPEGIVFKPDPVGITDFYNRIEKQPGSLAWHPNFARIARNGDLAFTAGPYIYHNGNNDTDMVYGDYVSIWRADGDNKFKLLLDLGIQHPEAENDVLTDFKNPDSLTRVGLSKDPFAGKKIIMTTDNLFNHSL
jgi:hypothetical protein